MLAGNTNDVSENLCNNATPSQDKYHHRLTVASSSILGVPKVLMNIVASETTKDMIVSINTHGMQKKQPPHFRASFLSICYCCSLWWVLFVLCFSFLLYRSSFSSINQSMFYFFCSQQGGMRLVFYIQVVCKCTLGISTYLPMLKNIIKKKKCKFFFLVKEL